MTPEFRRVSLMLALPLALAGCGGQDDASQRTAAGEVLPGSASDAMLPLDTLRSEPPLAPMPEAGGAGRERKGTASDTAVPSDAASEAAPDAPTDVATASAEPSPE